LINITKESFGISTAEAMLLWVPVLWYNQWATPELLDEKSGILIDNKEQNTIVQAIETIQQKTFDRTYIKNHIQKIIQKNPPQGWETYINK
jgi:glycosyltransferase involved in cell wall biosynthesis